MTSLGAAAVPAAPTDPRELALHLEICRLQAELEGLDARIRQVEAARAAGGSGYDPFVERAEELVERMVASLYVNGRAEIAEAAAAADADAEAILAEARARARTILTEARGELAGALVERADAVDDAVAPHAVLDLTGPTPTVAAEPLVVVPAAEVPFETAVTDAVAVEGVVTTDGVVEVDELDAIAVETADDDIDEVAVEAAGTDGVVEVDELDAIAVETADDDIDEAAGTDEIDAVAVEGVVTDEVVEADDVAVTDEDIDEVAVEGAVADEIVEADDLPGFPDLPEPVTAAATVTGPVAGPDQTPAHETVVEATPEPPTVETVEATPEPPVVEPIAGVGFVLPAEHRLSKGQVSSLEAIAPHIPPPRAPSGGAAASARTDAAFEAWLAVAPSPSAEPTADGGDEVDDEIVPSGVRPSWVRPVEAAIALLAVAIVVIIVLLIVG
jgi:hypothetical protein